MRDHDRLLRMRVMQSEKPFTKLENMISRKWDLSDLIKKKSILVFNKRKKP